jgi:hypothetical protein
MWSLGISRLRGLLWNSILFLFVCSRLVQAFGCGNNKMLALFRRTSPNSLQ